MTNQQFDCLVQRFVYYLLNGEFFDRYGIAVHQLVELGIHHPDVLPVLGCRCGISKPVRYQGGCGDFG